MITAPALEHHGEYGGTSLWDIVVLFLSHRTRSEWFSASSCPADGLVGCMLVNLLSYVTLMRSPRFLSGCVHLTAFDFLDQ
jgi:hypothetical protein